MPPPPEEARTSGCVAKRNKQKRTGRTQRRESFRKASRGRPSQRPPRDASARERAAKQEQAAAEQDVLGDGNSRIHRGPIASPAQSDAASPGSIARSPSQPCARSSTCGQSGVESAWSSAPARDFVEDQEPIHSGNQYIAVYIETHSVESLGAAHAHDSGSVDTCSTRRDGRGIGFRARRSATQTRPRSGDVIDGIQPPDRVRGHRPPGIGLGSFRLLQRELLTRRFVFAKDREHEREMQQEAKRIQIRKGEESQGDT